MSSVGIQTQWGQGGTSRKDWSQLQWVPSTLSKGGVNSGPDSHRIPDGVWTDGPGFSLCAAPLESSGPGFRDGRVGGMNKWRSGVYRTGDGGED